MSGLKEQLAERVETREPSMYKVVIMNDNFTTMDFVVMVLMSVFHKTMNEARRTMLEVHKSGVGVAGVYTYEIAETKVRQVESLAEKHGHPLRCAMEES